VVFSRGSRQCLGKNLALCELYYVIAAMVLRVIPHMRLYDTKIDDVTYDHDILLLRPKADSQGVRVVML
jgi:cytochrome P450